MAVFAVTTHPARNEDIGAFAAQVCNQGITNIHIDFMDGKFSSEPAGDVADITAIKAAAPQANTSVHIMALRPKKWVKRFKAAGADEIVFQIEAAKKPLKIFKKFAQNKSSAKSSSCLASLGIAIDLNTPIENIDSEVLHACSTVLVMLVKAGASGQEQ